MPVDKIATWLSAAYLCSYYNNGNATLVTFATSVNAHAIIRVLIISLYLSQRYRVIFIYIFNTKLVYKKSIFNVVRFLVFADNRRIGSFLLTGDPKDKKSIGKKRNQNGQA